MGSFLRRGAAGAGLVATMIAVLPSSLAAGNGTPAIAFGRPDISQELNEAQQSIDRKDWTGALVELKRALRKDHRNADVHNLMGYSYRKSGQIEEAFDSYHTALRLDPDHKAAHEYIGEAYLEVNQPEKAREHLAALKRICGGESCEEYRDLAKAVAAWHRPARATGATAKK
jgi:Tfp pilus assembly protein PilF